jgi:hypothetical protein
MTQCTRRVLNIAEQVTVMTAVRVGARLSCGSLKGSVLFPNETRVLSHSLAFGWTDPILQESLPKHE